MEKEKEGSGERRKIDRMEGRICSYLVSHNIFFLVMLELLLCRYARYSCVFDIGGILSALLYFALLCSALLMGAPRVSVVRLQ